MPPRTIPRCFSPNGASGSRCARSTSGSPSTGLVRACRTISRRTACAIPTAVSHLIEDGVDPTFVQFILSPRLICGSDQRVCVGDSVAIAISVCMVTAFQQGPIVIEP